MGRSVAVEHRTSRITTDLQKHLRDHEEVVGHVFHADSERCNICGLFADIAEVYRRRGMRLV